MPDATIAASIARIDSARRQSLEERASAPVDTLAPLQSKTLAQFLGERRPNEDELAAVLKHVEERDPIVADAMRVAAITGLRRGEVVRKLRWADVDKTPLAP